MFHFSIALLVFLSCCAADSNLQALPSWITSNPAFQKPKEVDSITAGKGTILIEEKNNFCWLIHVSDKLGYGIEIELEKLSMNLNNNDFVMITSWPPNKKFNELKLYVGALSDKRRLRLPISKSFLVLYSATQSTTTPELKLNYKRYGVSYEKNPSTTERPVLKETICDIRFKGISPEKYTNVEFVKNLKEAIRITAKAFCLDNKIPFDDTITTDKMVRIHRVSYCPFEWPDRDICASVLHSVFVSGNLMPGEDLIMDYELTADHLEAMWAQSDIPELKKLGLMVFKLPQTSDAILWWSLIIAGVMLSSLLGILVFWGASKYSTEMRMREDSSVHEITSWKKTPKLKLAPHQQIPSFMSKNYEFGSKIYEDGTALKSETLLNEKSDNSRSDAPPRPIKNYIGGFLFRDNEAFENEEENSVEFRPK